MFKKIRNFLLFSDIRKYILWYQEISLNTWYQKMIFWHQKIDFLISENRIFDILKRVIFLLSIMWISDINIYIFWYQKILHIFWYQKIWRFTSGGQDLMRNESVRIYGEPYTHKFCTVDIFGNITRLQAIPSVAKFHHVLGRGFTIRRVILIFIICLSANQKQVFYIWKYNIHTYCRQLIVLDVNIC